LFEKFITVLKLSFNKFTIFIQLRFIVSVSGLGLISPNGAFTTMVTTFSLAGIVGGLPALV